MTSSDRALVFLNVFGGCCTNAFTLENLLNSNPDLANFVTLSQLVYIALQLSPSFLERRSINDTVPRFKKRGVPLHLWLVSVVLMSSVNFLNNMAFAFRVPLSIQILVRSAGLGVAMLIGFLFLKKRYTRAQICSVVIVTIGVALATLSKPPRKGKTSKHDANRTGESSSDSLAYLTGVGMLVGGLLLSGILGAFQERLFSIYGPHWQEGIFYTHLFSIPVMGSLLSRGKIDIGKAFLPLYSKDGSLNQPVAQTIVFFALNLLTQDICVRGANQLTARVSSVTANLILTGRKALSLCISVWYFGDGWNSGMSIGAVMVFLGSVMYGVVSGKEPKNNGHTPKRPENSSLNGRAKEKSE